MSELTKEISKSLRGFDNRESIVEELCDVLNMLEQLKIIYQIDDQEIENLISIKLERLSERLEKVKARS